jgi:hypothetical protein
VSRVAGQSDFVVDVDLAVGVVFSKVLMLPWGTDFALNFKVIHRLAMLVSYEK